MQAAATRTPESHGLVPMRCHADVLVVPSQGQVLKLMVGGPVWADWDAQVLARHRREGEVADSRPTPMPPVETWDGNHVWGGQLIPHFGHLVAEHATRLAQSARERPGDKALFILQKNMKEQGVPGHVWGVLDWLGYGRPDLRIVTQPVQVDHLWVAPQAEMLGDAPPDAGYLALLERIATERGLRAVPRDRVYISRARLASMQAGRLLGEGYLCGVLAALGVEVCYPETMTLQDQLAMYAGARHLIFAEGSALHGRQLLGRHDQSITVLNRRPGWKTAAAALGARARSVDYFDICPQVLMPKTTSGAWAIALGASVIDPQALFAAFDSLDLDLRPYWNAADFQRQVDAELLQWLTATFAASVVAIDKDESAKAIDAKLQAMGFRPLDHWLGGVVRTPSERIAG